MEQCIDIILKEPKRQSGGVLMATSSIFHNVVIKDAKTAERFITALEESEKAVAKRKPVKTNIPTLTDLDKIRELIAKRERDK